MEKMLIAYAMPRGLDVLNREDMEKLTCVNIAFGVIRDGLLSLEMLPRLREELDRVRPLNPGVRFVLSVGGWGAGGFSLMCRTREGRERFAASVREALDAYRLDGVDIDWEYPCSDAAKIDCDPSDRVNFTLLMRALRDAVGDRIVSIAAGGGEYFVRDTQMDQVAEVCDYVQIMTYDLRSGFTHEAGHHTALYASRGDDSPLNTAACVDMFRKAGVPGDKIVIGAAFYCRRWEGVPDVNRGLLQTAGTVGLGGPGYAELKRSYMGQKGFVRYWDDEAQAPWLFDGSTLLSFDDPRSIAAKCRYLREQGLRGLMYWEHGSDPTHELIGAAWEALKAD